jgi:hypothetical protein
VTWCVRTTAAPLPAHDTRHGRWVGDNGPRPTDLEGPLNLISACPKALKRFVFVTSAGVERQKELPWAILNTFGACGGACVRACLRVLCPVVAP